MAGVLRGRLADPGKSRPKIAHVVERFLYDYARIYAGHSVALSTYVEPAAERKLRAAAEPILATGDRFRPDFGETGAMRLHRTSAGVIAEVEFNNRSVRQSRQGHDIHAAHDRVTMQLLVDDRSLRVRDYFILSDTQVP